jgi:hypothetical protein
MQGHVRELERVLKPSVASGVHIVLFCGWGLRTSPNGAADMADLHTPSLSLQSIVWSASVAQIITHPTVIFLLQVLH